MATLYVGKYNDHPGGDIDPRILRALLRNKRVIAVFLDVRPGRRQADLIVFTRDGVHVIEVKNYTEIRFDEEDPEHAPWHTGDGQPIENVRGGNTETPIEQALNTEKDVYRALSHVLGYREGALPVWPYVLVPFPSEETARLLNRARGKTGLVWVINGIDDLARTLANRDRNNRWRYDIVFDEEKVRRIAKAWGLRATDTLHGAPVAAAEPVPDVQPPSPPPPAPSAVPSRPSLPLRLPRVNRLLWPLAAALLLAVVGLYVGRQGGPRGCVTVQALNVRSGPGTEYAIVGVARQGECFRLDGRSADGGWARIQGGRWQGRWLAVRYLEGVRVQDLPVVTPTPAARGGSARPVATITSHTPPPPVRVAAPAARTGSLSDSGVPVRQTSSLIPAEKGGATMPSLPTATFNDRGLIITVLRVERLPGSFRVWLRGRNVGRQRVDLPLYENFFVLDDRGRQYAADPFASTFPITLAPGAQVEGYVRLTPALPQEVKHITVYYAQVYALGFGFGEGVRIENIALP